MCNKHILGRSVNHSHHILRHTGQLEIPVRQHQEIEGKLGDRQTYNAISTWFIRLWYNAV